MADVGSTSPAYTLHYLCLFIKLSRLIKKLQLINKECAGYVK